MTIYTIIGYREGYYNSRNDERSDSDIEIQILTDLEQAASQVVEFWTRTERLFDTYSFNDWEVRILVDGVDEDWWCEEYWDEDSKKYTHENPFIKILGLAYDQKKVWDSKKREREEDARRLKREREEALAAEAVRVKAESEKRLLAELKLKYPDA